MLISRNYVQYYLFRVVFNCIYFHWKMPKILDFPSLLVFNLIIYKTLLLSIPPPPPQVFVFHIGIMTNAMLFNVNQSSILSMFDCKVYEQIRTYRLFLLAVSVGRFLEPCQCLQKHPMRSKRENLYSHIKRTTRCYLPFYIRSQIGVAQFSFLRSDPQCP